MTDPATPVPPPPADPTATAPARVRRILTAAAWVAGLVSIALTIALAALGETVLSPAFDASDGGALGALGGFLMIAPPVLAVIALNLVVWRALLPALARRSAGGRAALALGTTAGLAVLSVLIVAALLLVGFFALTVAGG